MYAVRTKKVAVYGRRAQRYVAVSHDRDFAPSPAEVEANNQRVQETPSPKKSVWSPSPRRVPTKGKTPRKPYGQLVRRPLGVLPSNVPGSPAIPTKGARHAKSRAANVKTPSSMRQFSPFVDVDIVVLDGAGRSVREERRTSNTRLCVNQGASKNSLSGQRAPGFQRRRMASVANRASEPISEPVSSDDEYIPSPTVPQNKRVRHRSAVSRGGRHHSASEDVREEQVRSTRESLDGEPEILPLRAPALKLRRTKVIVADSESETESKDAQPVEDKHRIVEKQKSKVREPLPSAQDGVPLRSSRFDAKRGMTSTGPEHILDPSQPSNVKSIPSCVTSLIMKSDEMPTIPRKLLSGLRTALDSPLPLSIAPKAHPSYPSSIPLLSSSDAVANNARPLTPMKPRRTSNPVASIADPQSDSGDDSLSLDVSIDMELALALQVANLDLSGIPTSTQTSTFAYSSKSPKAIKLGKEPVRSRSPISGSSNLRQSLKKKVPESLRPLLDECGQDAPYDFNAFVETFPFDPIHNSAQSRTIPTYQKVGEASYSEVFGVGDVVLKVIPLLDDEKTGLASSSDEDTPSESEAKDVLKEIIVTRAVGNSCNGFIQLLGYLSQYSFPFTHVLILISERMWFKDLILQLCCHYGMLTTNSRAPRVLDQVRQPVRRRI